MVTKKTRLLSAIAAVLMLVSMFTCIVIPASAAEDYAMPTAPENLTAYKDRANAPDATDYAITDAYDWLAVIADSNNQTDFEYHTGVPTAYERFDGITLWFTNDIDFAGIDFDAYGDGDGTLTREEFVAHYYAYAGNGTTNLGGKFMGTIQGQGHAIKNLVWDWSGTTGGNNYRHIALIGTTKNALIRDLTIDASCSFKINRTESTSTSDYYEPFVGLFSSVNTTSTFINCHNEADVTIVKENMSTVSFSVFGRSTTGLTLIDCSNSGDITNNDGGRVTVLGDWLYSGENNVFYNCYNTGVLYTTSSGNGAGLFSTGSKNLTEIACDAANNYMVKTAGNMAVIQNGTRSPGALEAYGTILTDVTEAELAWNLNKNYVDTDYGRHYYTTVDGEIAYGTAANQTVKVVCVFEGEEVAVSYINAGEAFDLETAGHEVTGATYSTADTAATVTGSTIVVNEAPATDLTVTVEMVSTEVQYAELDDALAYYVERNTDWYVNAEGETLTATYEDIVVNMDGYNQAQVDAAVETLKGFSFVNNGADVFEVDSVEDFVAIATDSALFDADDIIYITADIDFGGSAEANTVKIPSLKASLIGKKDGVEGASVTISNIYVDTNWLGAKYYGETIANITFENCTAYDVTNPGSIIIGDVYGKYEHTFENIAMINCSATKIDQSNTMGLLIGRSYQGTKFTYKNIVIEGCSMEDISGRAGGNVNIAFLVGNAYSAAPTIMENVYLKGNSFYSDYIDTANGMLVGEISSTGSEFKNIAVLDTTVVYNDVASTTLGDYAPVDLLSVIGLFKAADAEMTVDNVIYAGTTVEKKEGSTSEYDVEAVAIVGTNVNTTNETVNISNVYTDVANGCKTMSANTVNSVNVNVNAGEAVTSGKAAAELNIAGVEQLWTMNGTTPEFGTEANKTVKIIAVNYGEEIGAAYVNIGEVVDVAELTAAYTSACTYAINEGEIVDGKITAFAPTNESKMIIVTIVPSEVEASLVADAEAAKADIDAFLATYADVLEFFTEKDTFETVAVNLAAALALVDGEDIDAATVALNEALAAYNALTYEVKGNVPYKYNELEKFAEVKTWAISDADDWKAAVAKEDYDFAGETLTLTADIDMKGEAMLPLSYANTDEFAGFAGTLDGDGHVFKNVKIEATPEIDGYHVGLVGRVAGTGVVMDLGIESGEIIANWGIINIDGGSNGMAVGAIAGSVGSGGKLVRCWSAADVKVVATELIINDTVLASAILDAEGNPILEDDVSIGGIVGRGLSGSLMDGCYYIGTVTGMLHASGLNDWGQATGAVYNSYDASTLIVDEETGYGQAIRYNTTSPKKEITTNTYAVGHRLSRVTTDYKVNTIENSNLLPVVAASGELAYLLNANATDMGNGLTYYKVENGKTVYATEADRTFRITLKDAEGNVLYAYANGGTELTIGGETIVVTADTEVTVANAAHEHNAVLLNNFFEGKDYVWSHQTRCDYATEIDGVAAYCTHADDVQEACTTEYRYVEDSADETHAHLADQFCTVCGGTRYGRSHAATNFNSEVTTAATLDAEGLMTYTCKTCPYTYTEVIEKVKGFALDTTIDEATGTAAVDVVLKNNPGVAGMTLNVTFDAANLEIVEVVAGDLNYYINTDPFYTENEDGTVTATFSVASGEEIAEDGVVATLNFNILNKVGEVTFAVTAADVVKADGTAVELEGATGTATLHTHEYEEAITEATCTAPGKKTYTCSCGDSYEEVIEQLPHTEEILPAKDATCSEAGLTEGKKCAVCGEILVAQEETEKLDHTEEILPAKAATCTETGLTEGKKCAVCGEILVAQEEIALADHTEEILPAKDATCAETGLTEGKKCSVCGEILVAQEEIPTTAHGANTIDENDYIVCSVCGEPSGIEDGRHTIDGVAYLVKDGKLVHGEYGMWGTSSLYIIKGRPAAAGVYTVGEDKVYVVSGYKLADGLVSVKDETIAADLGITAGQSYLFAEGKLVDGVKAEWTDGKTYDIIMGRPAIGGAFEIDGQLVYILIDGTYADGVWTVRDEAICEKLGIQLGLGTLFDNGVVVHGYRDAWVNGRTYYMDHGRPFQTGVSWVNGEPHFVTGYYLCDNTVYSLKTTYSYVAEAFGVAPDNYHFTAGRLSHEMWVTWSNGKQAYVVNGRPTQWAE